MKRRLLLALLTLASPALAAGPARGRLGQIASNLEQSAVSATPEEAAQRASEGFDWSSVGAVPVEVTAAPAPAEPGAVLVPSRPDLFVGTPQRLREPKSPLTADGEAKPQGTGTKLLWAGAGAAIGAGIGFLVGGLIGALIGAVVGGAVGWFLAP